MYMVVLLHTVSYICVKQQPMHLCLSSGGGAIAWLIFANGKVQLCNLVT